MNDSATGTGTDPTLYAAKLEVIMAAFAASGQTAKWVLTQPCLANPDAESNGVVFRAALAGLSGNTHVFGVLDLDDPTPAYDTLHYEGSAEMITIAERMAALLGYLDPPVEPFVPLAGAITLTGYAPSLALTGLYPSAGSIVLTGYAPEIAQYSLPAPAGFGSWNGAAYNGTYFNEGPEMREVEDLDREYLDFELWIDDQLIYSSTFEESTSFKLPAGYRTDHFSFKLRGNVRVMPVKIAETLTALSGA